MQVIRFFSFLILIIIISCSKNNKQEYNLIGKDTLVSIMVDLHLADAILQYQNVQSKIADISSNTIYNVVLKKYHVNKERFTETIRYYSNYPDSLNAIYDKVIEKLTLIDLKGYPDTLK